MNANRAENEVLKQVLEAPDIGAVLDEEGTFSSVVSAVPYLLMSRLMQHWLWPSPSACGFGLALAKWFWRGPMLIFHLA